MATKTQTVIARMHAEVSAAGGKHAKRAREMLADCDAAAILGAIEYYSNHPNHPAVTVLRGELNNR